jgi:hypothetical protein
MFAGVQNLHLSNGTIKFGQGFVPITAVGQLTTIRLTGMKLIIDAGLQPDLAALDGDRYMSVLEVSRPKTSLILESCTLEATFDSPALDQLAACTAKEGAHVCV